MSAVTRWRDRAGLGLVLAFVLFSGTVLAEVPGTTIPGEEPAATTDDLSAVKPFPEGAATIDSRPVSAVGTAPVAGWSLASHDSGGQLALPTGAVGGDGWSLPVSLLLLGYTRQVEGDVLANDHRRQIYDQVRATPGAHIAAIVDRTGIPRSTVRYHLRVLEDESIIAGDTIRGKHRYALPQDDLAVAAAVHDRPTRAVLEAVASHDRVGVSDLADAVGRAPSTVSHHIDQLVDVGLVGRERVDGRVLVRLRPDALGRARPARAERRGVATGHSD